MLKEFRQFLMRGNIVDLAIAVVIGAAFGALVTSLVANIITPVIAAIIGKPRRKISIACCRLAFTTSTAQMTATAMKATIGRLCSLLTAASSPWAPLSRPVWRGRRAPPTRSRAVGPK